MDGLAVRSVAYFMEERPVAFEWQNGDVLPGYLRATSPCACNVTRAATPYFSGASCVPHTFGSQCSPRVAGRHQWLRVPTAVKVSVVPRSRQHETTSGVRERTWIQQQLASPVVLSGIRMG